EAGAGRRRRPAPLASHHPCTFPSGVRSPGGFLGGVKISPGGFPIYTPLSLFFCPGIDFFPYAPYFLPPSSPFINFPPNFPHFPRGVPSLPSPFPIFLPRHRFFPVCPLFSVP